MNFYYSLDGKPLGPVTSEVLGELRSRATIDDSTLVIAEGEAHWVSYGERFPTTKNDRLPPTPISVKVPDSAAVAAQRVEGNTTAAAPNNPAVKEKISAVAYQRALAATSLKDEFNPSNVLEFPAVKYTFPFLDSLTTPKLCVENFFVIPGDPLVAMQLMIWNKSTDGLVRYDTIKASGGIELACKHLNSRAVHYPSAPSEWQETLNIFIPIALLLTGRKEPLRLQISRPNEGKTFVINISMDSVAAVLYRLFPDRYEVDNADLDAQRQRQAKSKAKTVAWTIGSAVALCVWGLAPIGIVPAVVLGLIAGVSYFYSPMNNSKRQVASPTTAGQRSA